MAVADTVSRVRVGILDTGLASSGVVGAASFLGDNQSTAAPPSAQEHGSRLAAIVCSYAGSASLLDARAFVAGQASSAARIAQAIDWLVQQNATIINMSFGLQHDREILATAITKAMHAGALCVASSPAQGAQIFPAAYKGVIKVSGDARCSAGEFSVLHAGPDWRFGGANGGPEHRAHERGHGASFACAHLSGALAQLLSSGVANNEAIEQFAQQCHWRGRECRL